MPKVNGVFALAVLATVALSVCGSAQTARPPMVGRWRGVGTIVVPWPRQRTLLVDITILASDSVAGKVGDATLMCATEACGKALAERELSPTP